MLALKEVNLNIQVYKYQTEEEMKKHIDFMISRGYKVKHKGKVNLSKESTVDAFCNEDNWYYVVEFYKQGVKYHKGFKYETEVYVF